MRIPHTIPTAAFEAFRCSEETKLLPTELDRTLRAEDVDWDSSDVVDLKTLALRVIANNWRQRPVDLEKLPSLEDRDHLLELLPLDLPFEVAITKLPYEHYWKRASEARWKYVDVHSHGGSWLRLYCERHLSEHLERAEPLYFDAELERHLRLLELVEAHVRVLRFVQLLPLRKETKPETTNENDNEEEEDTSSDIHEPEYHHLPLDVILSRLPDLREISINIGMIYMSDGVEWRDFEFSVDDAIRLGRGAKDLLHLRKFSLTKSALTRPRAAALLRGLASSRSLAELDFSHCKLGSDGALAVGGYLGELEADQQLRILRLTNNDIGAEGLAGIVRGLLVGGSRLTKLDLRLNPIGDDGAKHLGALLLRSTTIEDLNLSGCNLGSDSGMSMAEVIASGLLATTQLRLDCSNNEFGPIVGEAFEIAAKSCSQLVELDARMCGFRRESEFTISESVSRNRSKSKPKKPTSSLHLTTTSATIERRPSLQPPPDYQLFQRRRPAENLAPIVLASRSTIISSSNEEEEDEEDDEEEEDA